MDQLNLFSLFPQEYLLFLSSSWYFHYCGSNPSLWHSQNGSSGHSPDLRTKPKIFPAQLVLIIVHELFRSACLFSSDSRRAKAAGPQRPAFADSACNSVQDSQQDSRTVVQEGVHRVNISQSPQTGLARHKTRFCDFSCFYTTNDLRKNPTNGKSILLMCVWTVREKTWLQTVMVFKGDQALDLFWCWQESISNFGCLPCLYPTTECNSVKVSKC